MSPVSCITMNMRFGLAKDGPNSWKNRKRSVSALFENYAADFICVQEANNFQTNFLSTVLKDCNYIGERKPAPEFWQNNIIFHHHSWICTHKEHFFLSLTPDIPSRRPDSRWPRQCTLGIFTKAGRSILFINTHFDFDEPVQTESARMIMTRLGNLPANIPAVLMGDFNCPPTCPTHQVFTGHHDKIKTDGPFFTNIFKSPQPGTRHGFTGNSSGDHIDWILFRGNLTPTRHMVIQFNRDGCYPSDHFPLYAAFEFTA
ncbi:MAG: endonuclease/exonuclease/phosphatase family protein [Desulfobacterales bacterium]|nr:endonuclease/exonuclease/phosphatase family protein [Desulfobacterales bacterium]